MFLIQTRRVNNAKGFGTMLNSASNAQDWSNYVDFDDIGRAKRNCELMIKHGQIKAEDIRIVEVVCTFQSEIIVSSKE